MSEMGMGHRGDGRKWWRLRRVCREIKMRSEANILRAGYLQVSGCVCSLLPSCFTNERGRYEDIK